MVQQPNGNIQDKARQALAANQTSTAMTKQTTTRKELQDLLTQYKAQIQAAIPKHLTPERLIRVALTAVSRQPKLLECAKETLIGSIIQASQLGLEPDGVLGQAYLVPFRNSKTNRMECQFIPGYRGYIDLARRSGNIESIMAQVVRSGDVFEYEFGLQERLRHVPAEENRGDITHVYAYAKFTNGGYAFEVMTKKDVDKVMAKTKSRNQKGEIVGPWVEEYEAMARKTAIRRLAKYLPLSVEFAKAVNIDEAASRGSQVSMDLGKVDTDTGEILGASIELDTEAEVQEGEAQEQSK